MKVREEFILREIAGEHILVPVGDTALKVHGMISLSESGLLLFEKLQNECSEKELVQEILAEYAVDKETAEADVKAFIVQMKNAGILEGG